MRIQLLSDLHINFSNVDLDCSDADVLIIAGDLSNDTDEIVQWMERKIPDNVDVVYVLGNHEYERKKFWYYADELKGKLSHLSNVHVLQNDIWEKDGVRFVGTTLWSDFRSYGHMWTSSSCKEEAREKIIDFKIIEGKNGVLTPNESVEANEIARAFIKKSTKEFFDGKTVVVTHFLPSIKCVDKMYLDNKINAYYASNLEEEMENVDVWCFGHTHKSVKMNINGTDLHCNPRGYSRLFNIAENDDFNERYIFDLPSNKKAISQKRGLKNG
jgi:predicted phosphodiesterase